MWVYNNDLQKWYRSDDTLTKGDFDYLKQELSSTRYYSKALSGSTYMIINDLNNMYDILNSWKPRNWYISTLGSKFSKSINPKYYPESIDITSQNDFYNKNMKEYSLSLKNLFTPDRVINEFMENYIQVDLATDTSLNLSLPIEKIDGVKLIEGHKILVKNQTSKSNLNINDNPDDFFDGYYKVSNTTGTSVEYEYSNELNGIYTYQSGLLVKSTDYDNYENCIRLSVNVSMGTVNVGKQYHLNRLLNGFYPKNGEPMYFSEGHNWMVRNRVDYNNLFEINYYDVLKNTSEKVVKNGITYSIPERIIQIGEFGVFTNTQFGKTNLIDCKWKVNLRSISQTEKYYWVCGDSTTLLKVDKTNFEIEFVKIETFSSFKSIKFYDNLRGVLVGDFNNIYITDDGGLKWKEIKFQNFNAYSYNKVLFKGKNKFYVCGNGGVFIEFSEDIDGWTSHKRRISKKNNDGDDLLLVDMINDMVLLNTNITLSAKTINKGILLATNDNKLIIYDEDKKTGYDFIYLNFNKNYGDIKFLSNTGDYFSSDKGLFKFNLSNWSTLKLNTSISNVEPILSFDKSVNRIFKYSTELYIVGNYSLNKVFNLSTNTFDDIDSTFYGRLKSKLVFLNYDIASKLNFFTDEGEYRLPNSIFIQADYFNNSSIVNFTNLKVGVQNQLTWYDYWLDKEKTFKYGTTSLIESNSIKPSLTFKGTQNLNSIQIFKINATSSSTGSMYNDLNFNTTKLNTWNANNNNYNLYLKGNLMALYNFDGKFTVEEGDILRMESSLIDSNFLVSKIDTNWVYMYSNFNDNIIKNLSKGVSVKFTNLNKFKDYNSFISNFNNHSIGNGYKTLLVNNSIKINPTFNNLTSYYNLSTQISVTSSTSNFIKFSSPDMLNYGIPDGTASVPQILNCNTNIFVNDIELNINIIHNNTSNLIINLIGPSGKIINVFNKLSTLSTSTKFSGFNKILNVGTYKSNTQSLSDLLVNGSAKGDWKLVVEDTLVGTIGYLKNWSISLYGYISEDMKYTDGFLKFGYTPRYNLLDYLISINDDPNKPYFYADKEYLSLPTYYNLPLGPLVPDGVWMNSSGQNGVKSTIKNDNKIYFGENLKFEWTSILLNTFVDIEVYQNGSTFKSDKMLVLNKYYDYITNSYVIEFHKIIKFTINITLTGGWINIISRRKLSQISDDLGEFNNIHTKLQTKNSLSSYDNYLNFKITTDNYVKVLLSDVDTYKNITGIVYTDYKNELAINFANIGKEVVIPIVNTANIDGKLYIKCLDKHGLIDGQCIVLEFNGGQFSSQYLNQQYFGYQTVNKVYNEYEFLVNVNYGQDVYIGNDSGFIKYYKKDPFFNYQPVDIMDVSLNKEIKQAILLKPENTKISGTNWSLINVDFTKYRYRLVDGLTIQELNSEYQWILEAEISDAILGKNDSMKSGISTSKDIVWYSGTWEFGRWFGGIWYSGVWMYGDWYDGVWESKSIQDKKISVEVNKKDQDSSNSVWMNGRWFGGIWYNGIWLGGRFYDGNWRNGWWYNGVWNKGTWENGNFIGGIWVDGTWNNGTFNCKNEPAFWINGTWNGGDFENGIWYNGYFNQKNSTSRFGWGALASRPAYWNGGVFNGGSFYSGTDMEFGVSKRHTYAIWKTGKFINGNFYGGVVYNIDIRNSNWMGGILEEIQVIGLNEINNSFILNGIFRFNIGDEINITSKTKDFVEFGSLDSPMLYTIVKIVLDEVNKMTEIFVDLDIVLTKYKGYYESETKRGKSMRFTNGGSADPSGYTINMDGKNSIETNSTYGSITNYVYNETVKKILDVRVRVKLENKISTDNLSKLTISLKIPNGTVVSILPLSFNNTTNKSLVLNSKMLKDSIFSISKTYNLNRDDIKIGYPFYDGIFKNNIPIDLPSTGINKGYWEISINCDKIIKISDVYLEFCYDDGIGAQIGSPIENGFDTGLRVVSYFKNSRWKSGIWENGIFEDAVWESGIWYDGIFNGEWV
jgi:subtilisin-like proprotein convertase family protein